MKIEVTDDPHWAGAEFFWSVQSKTPWRLRGKTVLLSLPGTDRTVTGMVIKKVGLRLAFVLWPETVEFTGTARGIAEFKEGFFDAFSFSLVVGS